LPDNRKGQPVQAALFASSVLLLAAHIGLRRSG